MASQHLIDVIVIYRLPDGLFSASEAVQTVLVYEQDTVRIATVTRRLNHFINEHATPDNARRDRYGNAIERKYKKRNQSRYSLLPGASVARWKAETWRSALRGRSLEVPGLVARLLKCLVDRISQRQKVTVAVDLVIPVHPLPPGVRHSILHKPLPIYRVKSLGMVPQRKQLKLALVMGLACLVFAWTGFVPGKKTGFETAQSGSKAIQSIPPDLESAQKGMLELHYGRPSLSRRTLKEGLTQSGGKQRYMIGLAWVALESGDFIEARRLAQYVLDNDPPDSSRAACLYVLGWAATRDGNTALAHDSLTEALNLFSGLGQEQDQFNVHLALAYFFMQTSDLNKADTHLSLAFTLKDLNKANHCYLYSLKSKIEFLKGNVRGALNYAHRELSESKSSGPSWQLISAYQSLAFFQAAVGADDQARATLTMADSIQGPEITEELRAWRELTQIMLRRCDRTVQVDEGLIAKYLTKTDDASLRMILNQVESM